MFNTILKQQSVVSTAYAVRFSLIFLLSGFSPHSLAEISAQNESGAFLTAFHAPRWAASNSRVTRSVSSGTSLDYRVDHFNDHRVTITKEEFLQDMRVRFPVAAEPLEHDTPGELRSGGDDFMREWTDRYDNGAYSNSPGDWILDKIPFRYPVVKEYGRGFNAYGEGRGKGGETFDLSDLEHCLDTTRFFKPLKNRFRIETYYQRTVTHRSWVDQYANSYHGVAHSIHCHRDYDTIIPSVEVVDKSLAAVYRPDGKMISVRYEDRKGGSVFSELTLFFR